jgi:hypothetical protein
MASLRVLTIQDLKALPRIRPEDAAKYLQSGVTALEIRMKAQEGKCPFCRAEKTPNSKTWHYRVNLSLLIRAKEGEFGVW